jgi:hypothetical protein
MMGLNPTGGDELNIRLWLAAFGMACACGLAYARQDPNALRSACISNQKQLAMGILMYAQDYDEHYPTMTTPAHLQNRIHPYVRNKSVFKCPASGEDYLPNPALNYLTMEDVTAPAATLFLRDSKPHKSETGASVWVVAYADGHVATVLSEPKLGKPNPAPTPEIRRKQIVRKIALLRKYRMQTNAEIHALELELKRLNRHK